MTFKPEVVAVVNRLASKHTNFDPSKITEGTVLWRKSKNFINSFQFNGIQFLDFLLELESWCHIKLVAEGTSKTRDVWNHIYNLNACVASLYEMVEREMDRQNSFFNETPLNDLKTLKTVPLNNPVTKRSKRKYKRSQREGKYSSTEAANLMGIAKSTLNKYLKAGLVYGKLNSYGHVRYSQATVDAFNARNAAKDQGSLNLEHAHKENSLPITVEKPDMVEVKMTSLDTMEDMITKKVIDRVEENNNSGVLSTRSFAVSCFVDDKFFGYLTSMDNVEPAQSVTSVRIKHWSKEEIDSFFDLENGPIEGKCPALDRLIKNCEDDKRFLEVVAVETVKTKHAFVYDVDEKENPEVIAREEDELLAKLDKTLSTKEICRLLALIKRGEALPHE